MSDLTIPDVSEYQGSIDWPKLVAAGYPAAIIRAHNGYRADNYWARNRPGAHAAGVQALGIYQYVVASRDAAVQAGELCDLIGTLKPGEWPICDLEEGSGDQSARAHAWYSTVASRLNAGASEEIYSGEYFFNAHHLAAGGFKRIWLAAYSSSEPAESHELWQFTDRRSFPGIPGTNDASVFHGTVTQLLAHINPQGVDMPLTSADVDLLKTGLVPALASAVADYLITNSSGTVNLATRVGRADVYSKMALDAVSKLSAAPAGSVQLSDAQVQALATQLIPALVPALLPALTQALVPAIVSAMGHKLDGTAP